MCRFGSRDDPKTVEIHCKKQCFGLRRLPFRASGFGWVLAGSGRAGWVLERVLVGSGWVLELKNTTLKSLKFIVKKGFWVHDAPRWSENGL